MSKEILKEPPGDLDYPLHILYNDFNTLRTEYERLASMANNIEWKDNEIKKAIKLLKSRMKALELAIILFKEFNMKIN